MQHLADKLQNDLLGCQRKGTATHGILLTYEEVKYLYEILCNQKATELKKMQDSENNT